MSARITYYLGAGASYHSIPTVKDLPARMKVFMKMIKAQGKIPECLFYEEKVKTYESLIEDFKRYGTPDTLARNYYLTGDKKLDALKKLLSCYLIFEQLPKPKQEVEEEVDLLSPDELGCKLNEVDGAMNRMVDSIISDLDQRYNSFFATILDKPDKRLQLASNVNIISWNYDGQLERGYQDFDPDCSNIIDAQDNLNVIPRIDLSHSSNDPNVDICLSQGSINVLKLNGTGTFTAKNDNPFIYFKSSSLKDYWTPIREIMFLVEEKGINRLQFAWENHRAIKLARKHAYSVMKESDVVVIIGYSFPDFNRLIDRQIFSDFNGKLYIQDPDAEKIAQKIRGVNQHIKMSDIVTLTETTNFFIPFEFWE